MDINEILTLDEGVARTAALVAWLQDLFVDTEAVPVLVGGAAVELYTQGAYTTGDIDFVGVVPRRVESSLKAAGFERHGRHWIHEPAQVFVEFPGSVLDPDEESTWLEVEGQRIRVISVEDLLVDRLGAWEYWKSSIDGMNAFLIWRAQRDRIDVERLHRRVETAGWLKALEALRRFAELWQDELADAEVLEQWANEGPSPV